MSLAKQDESKGKESVIILAAGSSSRLGQPKQLVEVEGIPLLLKSTLAALDASYSQVVVVLGANANEHKKTIAHLPVEIITHTEWKNGMGSSLKAGLQHILKFKPDTNAVVIMVCDQPLITSTHLAALRDLYYNYLKPIIASRYNETIGVPALFDHSLFPELSDIKDSQGARAVIASHSGSVETIDWPEGQLDIDTPDDLTLLNTPQS